MLLTSTLAVELFKARNDSANLAVSAPNSRNYSRSSNISLPSVEELFDSITHSKLYDTLRGVMLRYISSDTFIYTVYRQFYMSVVQVIDMKVNRLVYPDYLTCHVIYFACY